MKITDIYQNSKTPVFSIEVLPPRNGGDEKKIFDVIKEVESYPPRFISITMGSDMSLRGGSLALAFLIKSILNIEVLVHCTGINRSREEVENLLTECRYLKLENILALRGDPPIGEKNFTPHPQGHKYAFEMVTQLVSMRNGNYLSRPTDKNFNEKARNEYNRSGIPGQFCIGAAGHPDGHPDCHNYKENIVHLKKKQDSGAQFIITQAFFHIDIFKRFVDEADKSGINIPIIPGLMPVLNLRNLQMVTNLFKVYVPKKVITLYENNKNNPAELRKIGIEQAILLSNELLGLKVKGIQYFTLNRKGLIPEILSNLPDSTGCYGTKVKAKI